MDSQRLKRESQNKHSKKLIDSTVKNNDRQG